MLILLGTEKEGLGSGTVESAGVDENADGV